MGREIELGFLPQRENIYNQKLPRSRDQDKDSNIYLKEIKLNLSQAVVNNDISHGTQINIFILSNKFINVEELYVLEKSPLYWIPLSTNSWGCSWIFIADLERRKLTWHISKRRENLLVLF